MAETKEVEGEDRKKNNVCRLFYILTILICIYSYYNERC